MLNILLPEQVTLKVEDAQHIAPMTTTLKIEDAQHIAPKIGHTKDRGYSTYCSQAMPH